MAGKPPASEFAGKTQDNTIQPKGADALTASERARLIKTTGSEEPSAPPDPEAFHGGSST
jgi:hypothetical protein